MGTARYGRKWASSPMGCGVLSTWRRMVRLGILGGTFNPIHYGHLVAANEVRDTHALDAIIFVPAAIPPHKDQAEIIDPQHRLIMTTLATLSHPQFHVSSVEVDRPGASYSVETVAALKRIYQEPLTVYFILGIDAFIDIATWRQPDVLLRSCHVIVTSRPGYPLHEAIANPLQQLSASYPCVGFEIVDENDAPLASRFQVLGTPYQIVLQEITALDISSTHIRQRVRRGQTITYLLPENVERYIRKHQLYR